MFFKSVKKGLGIMIMGEGVIEIVYFLYSRVLNIVLFMWFSVVFKFLVIVFLMLIFILF